MFLSSRHKKSASRWNDIKLHWTLFLLLLFFVVVVVVVVVLGQVTRLLYASNYVEHYSMLNFSVLGRITTRPHHEEQHRLREVGNGHISGSSLSCKILKTFLIGS